MDQELSAFIGDVHYRNASGADRHARAAAWCANRAEFDEALSAHLEAQGEALLWTEEVFEAVEWLGKFGHNSAVTGLARKVSAKTPVAMSEGKAEAGSPDDDFLVIEEIEGVEPLDAQFGVWPKLTVPAPLQEAMFGEPAPTDAERAEYGGAIPPMATYAILDAAKLPYNLPLYLSDSGLEYQSLFQGEAQEELGDHAPYIVRLEEGNAFTRKLFTAENAMGLWEKELGIFIRSRASLPELRKHFRKFTRVQDENGKWYYFRFWEGKGLVDVARFIEGTALYSEGIEELLNAKRIRSAICKQMDKVFAIFPSTQFAEDKTPINAKSMNIVKCVDRSQLFSDFDEIAKIATRTVHGSAISSVAEDRKVLILSCLNYYKAGVKSKSELTKLCCYELMFPEKREIGKRLDAMNIQGQQELFPSLEAYYLEENQ